eukprot:TRINITY_DN2544_c0_g1_i5.p1 TRINITY_DN2544_c0_g1~~TRINITY_DN2544_c0_g1_i5.p1  ORF type:complete len:400 (+),score=94.06 TRINITY_DN2544_c0_g1_i5:172-1200(+)
MTAAFLAPLAGGLRQAAVRPRANPFSVSPSRPLALPPVSAPAFRRSTLCATATTPSPPPPLPSTTRAPSPSRPPPVPSHFPPTATCRLGTLSPSPTPPPSASLPRTTWCATPAASTAGPLRPTPPRSLFPAQSLFNGSYRVSVVVPNFARVLDFAFVQDATTGGVRYDDNSGALFHIPVVNQLRLTANGEVQSYVAGSEDEDADGARSGMELDGDRGVDVTGGGGVGGVGMDPVLDEGEEAALHRSRGESALVGEAAGLGNIQISAARDAFERFDPEMTGVLSVEASVRALVLLGFEMTEGRLRTLLSEVGAEGGAGEGLAMADFMLVYADLENADEGIDIL